MLQADKIEMQKLKAIGVRNAVATLEEVGVSNIACTVAWPAML